MKTITIKWETIPGDPSRIVYYVDDSLVGENDGGFNNILNAIRSQKKAKVILKILHVSSRGGDSLISTLPFKDRFDELKEALGERKMVYEFF